MHTLSRNVKRPSFSHKLSLITSVVATLIAESHGIILVWQVNFIRAYQVENSGFSNYTMWTKLSF